MILNHALASIWKITLGGRNRGMILAEPSEALFGKRHLNWLLVVGLGKKGQPGQ